jgi:hypothetical protein
MSFAEKIGWTPKACVRGDSPPWPRRGLAPLQPFGNTSNQEGDSPFLTSQCLKCVVAMWIGILALSPTAVFAQQDKVQPETAQAKSEDAPKQNEDAQPQKGEDGKLISVPGGKALGMSILGNQEAPKALVIVPWKRSELGNVLGISTTLDDSRLPIDKEVFMRMLSYYEIRSETPRPVGAPPTQTNSAQPTTGAQRRK